MSVSYSISLPDPAQARGPEPALSFTAHGAEAFAEQLQVALTDPAWIGRWLALQDEPEDVDPDLSLVDPEARVSGEQHDLRIDLQATTRLPGEIVRHRLRLLAGSHWELRNVR